MSKPIVAIIGKPNVGKSRFFNYVVGQRISIVEDTPGVTRDRIYAEASWRDREFTLIDTAGIEEKTDDVIISGMREQANIAINIASVFTFFPFVSYVILYGLLTIFLYNSGFLKNWLAPYLI